MKQIKIKTVILVCALGLLGTGFNAWTAGTDDRMNGEASRMARKRVMLLGASVGKAWELAGFPNRMHDNRYDLESMAIYQFDKTEALEEVLMRPKRKFRLTRTYVKGFFEPAPRIPDTIIIKECAAYFPGELSLYKELIAKWVKRIGDAHKEVILATVVPVTSERTEKRKGQIEAIWEFNDWIREYARRENIVLLDLEAALRVSSRERFLQSAFSSGDGLHLNRIAYDNLDKLLQNALQK